MEAGGPEVQTHPWLHSKFQERSQLKNKQTNTQKTLSLYAHEGHAALTSKCLTLVCIFRADTGKFWFLAPGAVYGKEGQKCLLHSWMHWLVLLEALLDPNVG